MEKKYFDTKKGSVEEKINTIASEQPTINATYTPDVKLTTEKKYFETKPGSLADAASKVVSEALDPVNKDAVKKKFDDRKDKDIDNDGDVDSSDKFLHKRRKAISKAVKEDLNDKDKPAIKKVVSQLKKAVQAHGKQADMLDKAVSSEGFASDAQRRAAFASGYKEKGKDKKEAVTQDDHGEVINQIKKDAAMKKTDQKKDFKSLRAETKIIKLGDKGKTATGKDAGAIDVEPSAKPI
tara:strand:- start:26 stop:739 length:714 start_codon:yes stop_codon:yes gene_type:complete